MAASGRFSSFSLSEEQSRLLAYPPDLTVPVYDSPVRSPVAVTISASGFQLPWTLSPPRRWP